MRTYKHANIKKGLSLIEVVVYVAIIALILVAVVNLLLSFSSATAKIKNTRTISISAQTTLDRVLQEARAAQRVVFSDSVFNMSPGVLKLEGIGGSPTTTFSVVSGRIQIVQGSAPVFLTGGRATVDSLIFRIATTSISESVKIELQVSAGSGNTKVAKNFYTSAVLRGSY